ncbi:MAG TPA: CDP-alcohol phosphatidyltransferase family protein [Thermoanaerobaculia bacterium]|jgi:CDP-diacylglycerol--glycerol-3-phosphate 3-phosphatidyltransferase
MARLPTLLVALRAALGPLILVAGLRHWPGFWLVAILVVAFLSDVFDGIIARRLGVATERLRLADSVVDIWFYLFVAGACLLAYPDVWRQHRVGILLVASLEASRWVFDLIKFGKVASYHMWSAKLWGITLFLGFCEVFVRGGPGVLFTTAIAIGVVNEIEGFLASLILPRWRHDVPSVWHAWTLRKMEA